MTEEKLIAETPAQSEQSKETLKLPESSKVEKPTEEPKKEPVIESIYDFSKMTKEEIAEEAKKWGAIPKEEWKSDIKNWQDPETFLKNSVQKAPALINQNKKQRKIIEMQKKVLEELRNDRISRKQEKLDDQIIEAVENGDVDKVKYLRSKEAALQKEKKEPLEKQDSFPSQPQYNAEDVIAQKEWEARHPEYRQDVYFQSAIHRKYDELKMKFPNQSHKRYLDAIDIYLKKQKEKKDSSVVSGNLVPSTMGKPNKLKSYQNLTAVAKRNCDGFVLHGGITREDYLKRAGDDCFVWGQK
jgi:hypothetical protein